MDELPPVTLNSLTDVVNLVMTYPLTIAVASKSVAFRCRHCDVELTRYQLPTFRIERLTVEILSHIPHCTYLKDKPNG